MSEKHIKNYKLAVSIIDDLIAKGIIYNDAPYFIIQNRAVDIVQKRLSRGEVKK